MDPFRKPHDIMYGINHTLWKSFSVAIKKQDEDLLKLLAGFITNIIYKAIKIDSIGMFVDFISFPTVYYDKSCARYVEDNRYNAIRKICADISSSTLKNVGWLGLKSMPNYSTDLNKVNSYYYYTYSAFTNLLYTSIKYKAIEDLEDILRRFKQSLPDYPSELHQLKFNRDTLIISGDLSSENLTALNIEIELRELPFRYHKHGLLAVVSWAYLLYNLGQYSSTELVAVIRSYVKTNSNIRAGLSDLYEIIYKNNSFYLGIELWDYTHRPDGEVYSKFTLSQWLIKGFALEILRTGNLFISEHEKSTVQLENFEYLLDSIIKEIEKITVEYDKWKCVFEEKNFDEINLRSNQVKQTLSSLKRKSISKREKDIAEMPLDVRQVENFYNTTGIAWRNTASIHSIFLQFGNIEVYSGNEKILKTIGQRWFFEKAKMMFIDPTSPYHQKIYGIDSYGANLGRWEDNFILTEIFTKKEVFSFKNLLQGVEDLRSKVNELFNTTLIIAGNGLLYTNDQFWQDEKFVRKKEGVGDKWLVGYYDSIPVYYSTSETLHNRFIVCDFVQAFTLKQRKNIEWFDEELKVEVRLIDNAQALSRLNAAPNKWKTDIDGQSLSDEDALTLIKTSVEMDIWLVEDIIVNNLDAFNCGVIVSPNNL